MMRTSLIVAMAGLFSAVSAASSAEPCGLCAKEVVMTAELATCFLQELPELEQGSSPAVAIDLTDCGGTRGVIEALPLPNVSKNAAPDVKFLLSRDQLSCLKSKLENPDLVLDPSAKIELDNCG